jgi:hypothetical protein
VRPPIRIELGKAVLTLDASINPEPQVGDLFEDTRSKTLYRITKRRLVKSPHGEALTLVCSTKRERRWF